MKQRFGLTAWGVFALLVVSYFLSGYHTDLFYIELGPFSLPFMVVSFIPSGIALIFSSCEMVSQDLVQCNPAMNLLLYMVVSFGLSGLVYIALLRRTK